MDDDVRIVESSHHLGVGTSDGKFQDSATEEADEQ